ncbi:hypothetical protein MF410_24545 (plasmid) [Rhizobium sp. C104]|uniref:hypothetical protein n=1 Tax=Rhizobium sp. C104 TaxID=2917727 RepID=UPI001EF95A7C|nr:hypothetical protein [Rhizobium sp. C104]ULJ81256.1 hypothetical protein MF410_24545 [Rhizobium sp. C104]
MLFSSSDVIAADGLGHDRLFDKAGRGYNRQKSLRPFGEDGQGDPRVVQAARHRPLKAWLADRNIRAGLMTLNMATWQRWSRSGGAIAHPWIKRFFDDVGVPGMDRGMSPPWWLQHGG